VAHTDPRTLSQYMWAVAALAAPILYVLTAQALNDSLTAGAGLAIAIFTAVLVIGEMWPIPVARGQEAGDEITVSSTFGFALLLVAPVFYAIAAQALALIIDWVVRRRAWQRLPFNIAQYGLAFAAARFAYAQLSGEPFTPHIPAPQPNLTAALAGAIAFLLVNNFLVAVAVAISLQMSLVKVLTGDIAWQIATSAPLLGLGPLAAQAMAWTPISIVLLLLPIGALHHSGRMAMRREKEALRDTLTGLANRTMITTAAHRALSASTGRTAMLLLDLDHFKEINDTLGHGVGDEMLTLVADRLRAFSDEVELVGRLGGDEFVILQRNVASRDVSIALAERVCQSLRMPVDLHGVQVTVGCSIGIAFGPDHADNVPGLLRCADVALYDAKTMRDAAVVYTKQLDRHSAVLLGLQADLRNALENGGDEQLWVAYQPQLDLADGRVNSVECLARWHHPELGDVEPDTFIPIAESSSLTGQLLRHILDLSLRQLAAWDTEGLRVTACVNLSTRQVADPTLPETVARYLARYAIAPERLVLEVTESRLMADPELCAQIIGRLHTLGVRVSIDDFGTGYSSLGYLQRLAADELKIDKGFTLELAESGDTTIVRSTVDLGHNLGLRVVAEGVEDGHTAQQLADIGCDLLQGYFIGRPATAAETTRVLRRAATGTNWRPTATSPADVRRLENRAGRVRRMSAVSPLLSVAEVP
jgi:diguanylate cyclase (GGDEF)-like protein